MAEHHSGKKQSNPEQKNQNNKSIKVMIFRKSGKDLQGIGQNIQLSNINIISQVLPDGTEITKDRAMKDESNKSKSLATNKKNPILRATSYIVRNIKEKIVEKEDNSPKRRF